MSKLKTIVILTMVLCACCFCTACMQVSETPVESVTEEIPTESETSAEAGLTAKATEAALDFIKAVKLQNYDGITNMINLPDNAFVIDDDVKWFVEHSALGNITGSNEENHVVSVEDSDGLSVQKKVSIKVGKKAFSLVLVLNDESEWKINLPALVQEKWVMDIPKGCSVTMNEMEVSVFKREDLTSADKYDEYVFPAIAKRPYKIRVTSSLFGTFEQSTTPQSASDHYVAICKINDLEVVNILTSIQAIWNGLYTDYGNGATVTDVTRYFSDSFASNDITNIMLNYFPALENTKVSDKSAGTYLPDNKENPVKPNSGFYMKEIIPWIKNNYGAAILVADDIVQVNFGYRLEFTTNGGGLHNANKVSQVELQYANSTYKLASIPDSGLFTDCDYTKNDY